MTKPKRRRSPRKASPSPADIRRALAEKLPQPTPMTVAQADAVLVANGIPPAPVEVTPKETWCSEIRGIGRDAVKVGRDAIRLFTQALVAVFGPLLTAAVDGLGILIAAMTIYELWHPTEAMADAFLAYWGR